jgi:hypothetical protein
MPLSAGVGPEKRSGLFTLLTRGFTFFFIVGLPIASLSTLNDGVAARFSESLR